MALPAAAFLLLFLLARNADPDETARTALLRAATLWGVALSLITELLSLGHALHRWAIAGAWGAIAAGLAASWIREGYPGLTRRGGRVAAVPLLVLPIVAIVLGTGLSAARGWPNQWDSMVYHLSRVDHWLADGTVAFYPTHIIRQLFNPPGAEYAILHLRALGGDDRWSNAPQWLAMLGSLAGVSAVARRLGATSRGQLFAALVAATIPMGILQASGTQNDYLTAFWLVCLAEAVLSPPSRWRTYQLGAAAGLALLAKGTALMFAPALLLALPRLSAGDRARRRWVAGALVLALALNAPHWARNSVVFGWPLGPRASGSADGRRDKLTNDVGGPRVLASNLLRNLALHAGTPFPRVNRALEHVVQRVHGPLGLAVDDPRTTRLYSDTSFAVHADATDPDRAGNPAHLVLGLLAVAFAAATRRPVPGVRGLTVALAAAWLLFCMVLKWQPWHSRLQLPLFVLAAPLVAVMWERWPRLQGLVALALTALAARPLLHNRLAPLAGRHTIFNTARTDQYFQSFGGRPSPRQQAYIAALELLGRQGCDQFGVRLAWDDWEHPLWVLESPAQRQPSGSRRLEHVGVANASSRLREPGPAFSPCAIVAGAAVADDSLRQGDRWFYAASVDDGLRVYLPRPAAPPAGVAVRR